MLQFLIFLLLTSGAQKTDAALVNGVRDTLDLCSNIVEAVGDFLSIFEEERRRDSDLGKAVTRKLRTCRSIIELVDGFRKKHFSSPKAKARGLIVLKKRETQFLNEMLKGESKKLGETLLVASKDGDKATTFRKKCGGQGPTVVIVESTTGAIFGGYTDMSWKTSGSGWTASSKAFVFRLRPAMTQYKIKSTHTKYAMYNHPSYGPTFGTTFAFTIVNGCLSNTGSYTVGGNTFTGLPNNNYQLNDGSKYFKVKDYVVMKAIKM